MKGSSESSLTGESHPSSRSSTGTVLSASDFGLPERLLCPFCDGDDTELHSPFGSALSVATYWCRACHTAFEWFKG